jgi:hypothetical protein
MAEMKTKPTTASVSAFLKAIEDKQRREDAVAIADLMRTVTKTEPKMWGTGIVGFGSYHYKYASGREGDWFPLGFAPRKDALTLYLCGGLHKHPDLLAKLGKYKTGQSCLYIKKLADVDQTVLKRLMTLAVEEGPGA